VLDAHYDHFIVPLDVDENEPFAVIREIIEGAISTVDRELIGGRTNLGYRLKRRRDYWFPLLSACSGENGRVREFRSRQGHDRDVALTLAAWSQLVAPRSR
jgi:hypothetical protein